MINPLPELTPMLKQLRLSNMAETLAQRNREAIEKQLSYPEFLALLVQDEVARRDQKKYDSRLRRAGFRANKTIESFDMNFNPGINIQQINELTSCNFIDERVAVLIAGPCGTGKSHLAQAIGHCAVQKGYDVAFYTQAKLLAYLNAARATNMYERRFQALVKVPLLIIDDFGLKPLKSPQDEDIHDLIDERYENTATIITSNLDYSEWGDAFPNKLLGAATLDRLRHNAYRVTLEGDSYRSKGSRQK
ncbi:MAG: IS21-like element helper ATPase IstB [Alteromonas sp.]